MPPASVRGPSGAVIVEVSDRQRLLRVAPRWLAGIARRALRAEGVEAAEIGVTLVDDRRMAALHEREADVGRVRDVEDSAVYFWLCFTG